MAQDFTKELETQLAIEILNLFQRERLTATQAKSLIERVRVLIDAGEMGFFNTQLNARLSLLPTMWLWADPHAMPPWEWLKMQRAGIP